MSDSIGKARAVRPVGHLLVTIQLDPPVDTRQTHENSNLAAVTRQLLDVMNTHRLPATWAVSDPAHSAATPLVLRSDVPHELAILGDPTWVGPSAGRTRFARELARRISQSRHFGLNITTFVPRLPVASLSQAGHIDLIVKQQITAICGPADWPGRRPQDAKPRALHYGVWEFPAALQHPSHAGWLSRFTSSTWRQIRHSIISGSTYHLLIDAPATAELSSRAVKTVARWMRRAAAMRSRGLLEVETLHAASARLSNVPASSPQQSILRRAA